MALTEYVQFVGQAPGRVTVPLPVAWLEGDVLAEYVRFLYEAAYPDVKWLEGDVLADFLEFLGEAERREDEHAAVHSSCGNNGGDDDLMEEDDDHGDEELARLLPHIMSIPAVMERAAAAPVQETRRLISNQEGWL